MQVMQNTPIARKLTLLVLAAVAVALLLSCIAFVANDIRFMRGAMVRQLTALADVLGSNTTAALTFDDSSSAEQVLESLKVQPSVRLACIYDAEGRLFARYAVADHNHDSPPAPRLAGHRFTADGHLDVSAAIFAGDEQIGTIYLHATLDQIREQLVSYAAIVIGVLTASFTASYLLASRLQRAISGPILALARAADRISSEQDYSMRVTKTSNDELGTLYDEFNHMLERVETGKRDLEDAHRRLERMSQERMRAIVETAADGIVTFTADGAIDSCNGASCELLGYSRDELIGSNVADLWKGGNDALMRDEMHARSLANTSPVHAAMELEAVRKDGTAIPLLVSLSEFCTDDGRLFTAILRDLSEFKRLQRELVQAQRLESIGQLAAGIAHEINTPMQFVSDNIEYLRQCTNRLFEVVDAFEGNLSVDSPPKSWEQRWSELGSVIKRNQFGRIREQIPLAITESIEGIERVKHIVGAMKEFSHPGGAERMPTDLNRAIESTATITRNQWKYVADMQFELDPNMPSVWCFPAEMNQVLLNLVVNAADAIAERVGDGEDEKGRITVRSRPEDAHVVIEVEDTGCGISDEIRDRIFDPFFTTKDVGKGTGQGLAICYNVIVNKHKGTLEVESSPGVGTLFRVTIPSTGPAISAPSDREEAVAAQSA